MSDHVTLRPAGDGDRAFTWTVKEAALRVYVEAVWGWVEEEQREFHRRDWEATRPRLILFGEEPVGTITVRAVEGALHVGEFYILPAYQRRGIGSGILARVFAEADAQGLPIRLEVIRLNPARHLYLRHGFRITGETATHFRMERISGG